MTKNKFSDMKEKLFTIVFFFFLVVGAIGFYQKMHTNSDKKIVFLNNKISPGNSPGKLELAGSLEFGPDAIYEVELKDLSGAGLGHDIIEVSDNVDLDGTLEIVLDGYTPLDVDQFDIITFGGNVSGTFESINMPASMNDWEIDYGFLVPNKVTIYGPNIALPVTLVQFDAREEKAGVVLEWETASEINFDYFTIQHSADGIDFSLLDEIESSDLGRGFYSYVHKNPLKGINYYRLQMVDLDGSFEYSAIETVHVQANGSITFEPNPAFNMINFSEPVDDVKVYDQLGRELIHVYGTGQSLDVSELSNGIYFIAINNEKNTLKLIITK